MKAQEYTISPKFFTSSWLDCNPYFLPEQATSTNHLDVDLYPKNRAQSSKDASDYSLQGL